MTTSGLLLFLNLSGGEIIIILLVILLVLGPDKIPEFARKARDVMRYVRKATDDIKTEINKETDSIQKPFKAAYEDVSAFSKNANDAMKSTLENIEKQEKEAEKDNKKTKTDTVSLDDLDKEIEEQVNEASIEKEKKENLVSKK